MMKNFLFVGLLMQFALGCEALSTPETRRDTLGWMGKSAAMLFTGPAVAFADTMDIDNFLKTGGVAMPMGVSGQGGKMRPETGVVLRDGSEISRDSRNGNVSAEIVVKSVDSKENMAVLTSFSSPWPLAEGSNYDIECRDAKSGDGAYLVVSSDVNGKKIEDLSKSFFINQLFSTTGRFSFYGEPTDIKVKNIASDGAYRMLDVSFSILSQSTGAEVPRKAKVVATIPDGTSQVVMLVGSASANRWKNGAEKSVSATIDSFRATTVPSALKIRAKDRFSTA